MTKWGFGIVFMFFLALYVLAGSLSPLPPAFLFPAVLFALYFALASCIAGLSCTYIAVKTAVQKTE